jgi:hypothetical protein
MRSTSPFAGKTVKVKPAATWDGLIDDAEYRVEDWWQNVYGQSWMTAEGNPAALIYAMRAATGGLPTDDEVLYGKVGPFGYLVHMQEIGDVVTS